MFFRGIAEPLSSTFDERPAARKQSVKYVVCAIHAQSISCCCSNPTHRSPQWVISSACLPAAFMAGLDFLMASCTMFFDGALAHVDRKHLFHQRSQSLVRYALHHAQVGHDGSDVLAKSYLVAPLARLVSSIATSAGAGLLVMAIFSHDRRQRWQIHDLTYIVKLSRYVGQVTTALSRQYPLMQSSTTFGFSVIFLLCASCPGCPPGLRPLFFRKDFVRRITSAFIFSFNGGEECYCCLNSCRASHTFSSRLRRLRFSFRSLSTLRRKFAFSVCSASMASCIDCIQMSAFSRLAICP